MKQNPANQDYYLMIEGAQQGPYRFTQVRTLWREGTIDRNTLFWRDDLPEFVQCSRIANLLGPLPTKVTEFSPPTGIRAILGGASAPSTESPSVIPCPPIVKTIGAALLLLCLYSLIPKCEVSSSSVPKSAPKTVVENSGWDGSVSQVKEWLQENVNDPRSLEFVSWSPVEKATGGYTVSCTYRAKNGFGALITQSMVFTLDEKGKITGTVP